VQRVLVSVCSPAKSAASFPEGMDDEAMMLLPEASGASHHAFKPGYGAWWAGAAIHQTTT